MTKRLFEYLAVLLAVGMIVSGYFLFEQDYMALVRSVIPNLIAVITAFLLLHFLFSRQGIDVADVVSGREARAKYRSKIVPAARRLEKAIQRNQEFFFELRLFARFFDSKKRSG